MPSLRDRTASPLSVVSDSAPRRGDRVMAGGRPGTIEIIKIQNETRAVRYFVLLDGEEEATRFDSDQVSQE